ncbi:DNA-binding protein [Hymenobacter jeollabukensis]|uniref:DNA-binding protein n=1 Tax=Hymenobacter jeollabukensis TaxID=2025313 RepID=A0A5R8WKM0_9BACT|nr:DNA-binding protein [Hymenobacter jeollabukensis]TLM89374.1 DNA-binding protein [Hymenobacter jeollabukensis]
MQHAILVSEQEWHQLLADVQALKAATPAPPPPAPDRILKVREAAAYLCLTPEGLRKARRQGRVAGVRINEKEWGFRQSELVRYLRRYRRLPQDAEAPSPSLAPAA